MKFTLSGSWCGRSRFGSVKVLGYLPHFVLILGLLSGCSTRVDKENAGELTPQVVPTGQNPTNMPPNLFPPNGGGNYSPPVSDTNPYYPPTYNGPTYPSYPTTLNCYLERSGGYYYTGYPVRWDFYADNNEPLEVVRIDSGENWSSPPQYPLPSSFSIYFYTAGQRQMGFTVRSSRNPSQYCNGGSPIYDSIYVNYSNGYNSGYSY
jgi:hypothetical protein